MSSHTLTLFAVIPLHMNVRCLHIEVCEKLIAASGTLILLEN